MSFRRAALQEGRWTGRARDVDVAGKGIEGCCNFEANPASVYTVYTTSAAAPRDPPQLPEIRRYLEPRLHPWLSSPHRIAPRRLVLAMLPCSVLAVLRPAHASCCA